MAVYDPERLIDMISIETRNETGIRNAYSDFCGDLTIEDLFTTDTMYVSASRCARGFRHKRDTQAFMKSVWMNSYLLSQKVKAGKFRTAYYSERVINERGKLRVIKPPTFECKVVQKVLCDYVVRPALEPRMITHNYASIRGRGASKLYEDVYRSIIRAAGRGGSEVIVMIDFSKYFANIDLDILFREMSRYIRNEKVLGLIRMFSPGDYGLSLGNELSQVPASFFPSKIDHMVKDEMGIRDYFRYMDDSLAIISEDRVPEYLERFRRKAEELKIIINDDKIQIVRVGEPFTFCKERFLIDRQKGGYYRLQNPRIARTERRKLRSFKQKLDSGEISLPKIRIQYRGVRGMIRSHPNTAETVRGLDSLYEKLFGEKFSE